VQLFEQEISKNGISLVKHIDIGLPNCMADGEKILEAISNIFKNALESFNGIQNIRQIEVRADTKVLDAKKFLRVSIRDNGIGISKKDMKKIFEPFFTKGKKGGIGLGLPIFKKIIDAHNARIQIRSDEGKGTSFAFMIPVEISQ
jgi:signal transduction histidine kinase